MTPSYILYSTLLRKKIARAPGGLKKFMLSKLGGGGGRNRIDPKLWQFLIFFLVIQGFDIKLSYNKWDNRQFEMFVDNCHLRVQNEYRRSAGKSKLRDRSKSVHIWKITANWNTTCIQNSRYAKTNFSRNISIQRDFYLHATWFKGGGIRDKDWGCWEFTKRTTRLLGTFEKVPWLTSDS